MYLADSHDLETEGCVLHVWDLKRLAGVASIMTQSIFLSASIVPKISI